MKSKMPSWTVGMIAGAALGAAAMSLSNSKNRQTIKQRAKKAISSISNFSDELDDRMRS